MNNHAAPPGRTGLLWLVEAGSGLLLAVLLCLHMIANHFFVPGGLQTYADVVRYLSNPVIVVLELTFLVTVTGHAALGVPAILFDLGLSRQAGRAVSLALGALAIAAVGYARRPIATVISGRTMAIRLVTIDLDGTLLDSSQRTSARNLGTTRLLDAGVIIALATARDRASITGSVPLVRPGLFYLASGGALVYEVVEIPSCGPRPCRPRWPPRLSPSCSASTSRCS